MTPQAATLVPQTAQPTAITPMEMLKRASDSGASLETLDRLMALQERWEANEARKAFNEAVAAAKASIPPIVRNREGHNAKRYVDFAAIARVVDPILASHGLSYRFRTTQGDKINVTCVLAHRAGHFEETTLAGPADTSGNKNAIQSIGSTLTYLQRYSLVQMLGLAAADDDDGHAAGPGGGTGGVSVTISNDQIDHLQKTITKLGADINSFCTVMNIESLADLPASKFKQAMDRLDRWAAARKVAK